MIRGQWHVDFRFEGRRIRRRSPVNTKRGATQYEQRLRGLLASDKPLPWERIEAEEERRRWTVAEWLEEWLKHVELNNRPSTYEAYQSIVKLHLAPVLGGILLDELGPMDIERSKHDGADRQLSHSTINRNLRALSVALNLANRWGVLESTPTMEYLKEPPREFDFYTKEEGERLIAAATGQARVGIAIALWAGLRIGELRALRWGDADLVARTIRVSRTVWGGQYGPPKGGRGRTVPMGARLTSTLKAHRHLRGDFVLCHDDGAPLSNGGARRLLERSQRRAGLRRVGWHVLRHSFASQLVMAGVPLKAVQELLGHANITATMIYSHLSPSALREAVETFDEGGLGTPWAQMPTASAK